MLLNRYHESVRNWVREWGFCYVEEYPLGPYTLDIYLPDLLLCIEVDGPHHALRKKQDAARDCYLADHGITTLRVLVGTKKADVQQKLFFVSGAMEWR